MSKLLAVIPYCGEERKWHTNLSIGWTKQAATWYKYNSDTTIYLQKKILTKNQSIASSSIHDNLEYFIIADIYIHLWFQS